MKQTKSKILLLLFIAHCSLQIAEAQPTQEWVARYISPTGTSAIPNKMCLDKVGNCYIFGEYLDITNNVILIKYNSTGDTLWTRKYQNGFNSLPKGVIADSIGNSYITFLNGPDFGPYDIVTIKFNPQGVQQWIKIYNSGGDDQPSDIIMDRFNNVYVAGLSGNESIILKYNTVGDTVWTRKYSETGFRFPSITITIDNNNNIYLGGGKINITTSSQNYYTMKYDSNGFFKWIISYNFKGVSSLSKIKVDQNYNVYVTGRSNTSKMLTIKYDSTGIEQWQRIYDGPGSGGELASDMGIDNLGNIIVTGASSGISSGTYDYLTIKYSTSGDSIWVKRFNGTGNSSDEAKAVVIDDSNNVFITGYSVNIGVSWDYVTIKYFPNGIQAWNIVYNNSSANSDDLAVRLAIDNNRNIYVSGLSDGGGFNFDYVTLKYSQTVGLVQISNNIPKNNVLYQNFPNPFNPNTNIKFQISKASNIEIRIYDITGKEIQKVLNEKLQAGQYNYKFDGSELTSGIYFCKMTVNDYIYTKKMLLIK